MHVSEEAIQQFGLNFFIKDAMRYNKGFLGQSFRTGISGDDFVTNMRAIVVYLVRAPRIAAKKRLNKFSNRKLNRISR